MHAELKSEHKDLDFSSHDTEAYPKQATSDHPLGNALKLPLAINRKTG